MFLSDTLSRRPDFVLDGEHDNEDVVLLPDGLFVNLIDIDLQRKIANTEDLDSDIPNQIKTLLEKGPTTLWQDLSDWTTEIFEGRPVLFYKGKNYIPNSQKLRKEIVERFHDNPSAGHPGELETFNSIRQHYWWPGMRTFVKEYVRGCGTCQQFKIDRNPSHPSFMPIKGPTTTRPFANCSMDMITDLPPVKGYDSILVVVDHGLSKGVIIVPCSKTLTEEGAAEILMENLYRRFGLPDSIISD